MPFPSLFRPPAFWYPDSAQRRDTLPPAASLLLPLSRLVIGATRYRRRKARPQRVGIPVVCIGNVTLGGAGKTPLALMLAQHFLQQGRNPHFVSRGYGGRSSGVLRVDSRLHNADLVGDEALELAECAPCWVSRDRRAGALAAKEAGADMVILDDGLQNTRLCYDLSILVLDGECGLGNGCVLPAGPLREPFEDALSRCDLLVTMGAPVQSRLLAALAPLQQGDANMLFSARLQAHPMALPPRGRRTPVRAPEGGAGGYLPPSTSAGGAGGNLPPKRLLAFSGIGHGHKLPASLAELGGNVVARRDFPDHHRFSEAEARQLLQTARRLDARPVTTRKDALRLAAAPPSSARGRLLQASSILRVSARIADMQRFALCVDTILAARVRKPPRRNHGTKGRSVGRSVGRQ